MYIWMLVADLCNILSCGNTSQNDINLHVDVCMDLATDDEVPKWFTRLVVVVVLHVPGPPGGSLRLEELMLCRFRFLKLLLFRLYLRTWFSGCRGLLQILTYILFSHGAFLFSGSSSNTLLYSIFSRDIFFSGSLAGYVAAFLFVGCIACRIGLVHIRFCSLLLPSSLKLWFWLWHYTVFCLVYPCILVLLLFLLLFFLVSSGRPLFLFGFLFLVLLVLWILLLLWVGFKEPLWIGWSFVHRHWVLLRCLQYASSMCWFRAVLRPI